MSCRMCERDAVFKVMRGKTSTVGHPICAIHVSAAIVDFAYDSIAIVEVLPYDED